MNPDAPLILVRALHVCAVATLFGGAGFLLVLRRRPLGAVAVLRTAAVAAASTGFCWFALVFAAVAGGTGALVEPEAWSAFATAPFGPPWLARLALCAVAPALVAARRPALFCWLGAALLIDQAWLGHAANGPALGLAVYWLHVGSGFAWVGALVMLVAGVRSERRVPRDGLAIFAWLGVPIVITLVVAGLVEAALRGVTPQDLVTTSYGRIIAAKILLLTAMLGLALRHSARGATRLTLRLETALGLVVLALAAALGVTPPG